MTKTAKAQKLREIFKAMDPHKAQAIREAYYQVQEGLQTLIDELAQESEDELIDEWTLAFNARNDIRKSQLGKVL